MYKVIIVEDENVIREGILRLIDWEEMGFEIVGTARNGKEGLALIEYLKPDLALVDINMPIMNGLEMLSSSKYKNYKSIILSGYDYFNYAQEALKLGAFDYLLKPVLTQELISVLERFKLNQIEFKIDSYNQKKLDKVLLLPKIIEDPIILECFNYIDLNLSRNTNTKEISECLMISTTNLNKVFIKNTGYSFHKFNQRYRIRKAMQLLMTTNLYAYEVGKKVGYSDFKYFTKIFKDYTEQNISEFREDISYLNTKENV